MRRWAVVLAVASIAALGPAQAARASWAQQDTPVPSGAEMWSLGAVACTSASACVAAGSYEDTGGIHLLAESRTGATWTIQPIADPGGGQISSISCPLAGTCLAVGSYTSGPDTLTLAESWNGSGWSVVATPNPAGATMAQLSGIWCTSATACVAVGSYAGGGPKSAFAERWNGTSWTIQTIATPTGATDAELSGVRCSSASACLAVGGASAGSTTEPLAERWDGTSWTIQSTPDPTTASALHAIACSSATACTATGYGYAERWNGTSWALQKLGGTGGVTGADLSGVACPSATLCVGVGGYYDSEAVQMHVVETWNGSVWRVAQAPISTAYDSSVLTAIVCSNPAACTAVGSYHDPVTGSRALVELDSLKWQLQDAQDPAGSIASSLDSVSCSFPAACDAVGNFETSTDFETVAEGWNGTSWTIQATPSPSASNLSAAACPAASTCFAVGDVLSGGVLQTLAERWDGTSWSALSTPSPSGATASYLLGVSCTSTSACTAVGSYSTGSGSQLAFAERWNGSTWSLQSTPNPAGATTSALRAVACKSVTSCVAVGSYGSSSQALAEVWNGTSWTIESTPLPSGASASTFHAVACSSTSACTATGNYFDGAQTVPLAERWNGTSWSAQTPATPAGAQNTYLTGVSCPASTSCTAVGEFRASGGFAALAEHWNGTSWVMQAVPKPFGAQTSALSSVSCPTTLDCTAVGYWIDGSGNETLLAEQYS